MPTDDEHLAAMAEMDAGIAFLTGVRAKFIESGWSPEDAATLTIEMFRKANS